jgi:hypothetical protein
VGYAVAARTAQVSPQWPGTGSIISTNFDRVGGREVMLASGDGGIKSFDLSDPHNPPELISILPAGLNPNDLLFVDSPDAVAARAAAG